MCLLLNAKTTQNILKEAWPGWKMGFTTAQGNKFSLLWAVSGFVMTLSRENAWDSQFSGNERNILHSALFASWVLFKGLSLQHEKLTQISGYIQTSFFKWGGAVSALAQWRMTRVCVSWCNGGIFMQVKEWVLICLLVHMCDRHWPGVRGSGEMLLIHRKTGLLKVLLTQLSYKVGSW